MQRRLWLGQVTTLLLAVRQGGVTAATCQVLPTARSVDSVRTGPVHPPIARTVELAAAWDDAEGRHFVGLLAQAAAAGSALRVKQTIEVPTRAHGLQVEPGGSVLAIARRPGSWMLRWTPGSKRAQWLWSPPDRRFNGHVIATASGSRLCTTETDLVTGLGLVALRDARTLQMLQEWPTHGIDPHQLLTEDDGSLLVANGGVPTRPETGRVKLDRTGMDSSLVRLDGRDGRLLGQWRLDDARLSIRHLARHADATLGISLQAEHDDAARREAAPLLALFDGQRLRTAAQPRSLAGYGADIAATDSGFALAATRAGGVARWTAAGEWLGFDELADVSALARRGAALWAGGSATARESAPDGVTRLHALPGLRLDNHWQASC